MATTSRTFRIFVSSTFSDLKTERNALQEHVFPRLRELCQRHGARFQAIDLRWGVSEEAGLDQKTMRICLEEIARCQRVTPRPNFIILLGDRYGWQPLPCAIPADEMEQMLPRLSTEERRLALWTEDVSPTAQGSAQDAAGQGMMAWRDGQPDGEKGWYRLDTNSVPAVYLLQPRRHDSPFADYGHWAEQVEEPLRAILERAARETFGASEKPEGLLKYTISATHQEIVNGALRVEDAAEHVFGFFRTVTNLPALTARLPTGLVCDYVDTMAEGDFDAAAHARLRGLKDSLAAQLGPNVVEYQARWTGDGLTTGHIGTLPATLEECLRLNESQRESETLCEAVWRRLSRVILEQVAKLESVDPLIAEQDAHNAFGQERARLFVGRSDLLGHAAEYLSSDARHPLVIMGPSGSGKSALLAMIAERAQERHPNALIVTRFIGATPGSSDGRILIEGLTRQIVRAYDGDESDIPPEYSALAFTFRDRLALATVEKPLVLLVDALDQLSGVDEAKGLAWLPVELSEHVHLVVSTLQDGIPEPIRRRLDGFAGDRPFVAMQPLTMDDGALILDGWLAEPEDDPLVGPVRRSLTAEQRGDVLAKFEAAGGLPLYLKVAYEQARRWCSFDGLPARADKHPGLAVDVSGVIHDLFVRLEQPGNHGAVLVSHALGYLAAARHGLSEDELLDVLSADAEVLADFRSRSPNSPASNRLPAVLWSRLYFDLEPYLAERAAPGGGTLLSFYHRQVAEKAATDYCSSKDGVAHHRGLAAHFAGLPTWLDAEKTRGHPRKAAELAHQQTRAGLWPELTAMLTDFDFLEATVRALSVYDLEADYRDALTAWGGTETDRGLVAAFEERLRLESHHIQRAPELLFPQLYNHLTWLDKPDGPLHVLCERSALGRTGWLRMVQDPRSESPPWKLPFENHMASVSVLATTADGRIVTGSWDNTLKVWNTTNGRLLHSLEGHSGAVHSLVLSADGCIISGSDDQNIKVWDLETGNALRTLGGHSGTVNCLALAVDGRLVSGSSDRTVKLWDMESGRLLGTLVSHTGGVNSVVLTADGRIISSASDNTLKVWEITSGQLVHTLSGHTREVVAVALNDKGWVISGSQDCTIKVWELETGRLLRTLEGHTESVRSLAVTTSGELVSSSSDDTIKVWDLSTGQILHSTIGRETTWDSQAKRWMTRASSQGAGDSAIFTLADSAWLITLSSAGIKVWNLENLTLVRAIPLWRIGGYVPTVASTSTGHIVYGTSEGDVTVCDLQTGQLVWRREGLDIAYQSGLALTDDDRVIYGSHFRLFVVALSGTHQPSVLRTCSSIITAVVVTRDHRIVCSTGNKIEVMGLEDGRLLYSLYGHQDLVTAVALTEDKLVVSGSLDHTIKVWDLETGELLRSMEGHEDSVTAVLVTADGRVVSSSHDHTIRVWDLESGRLLQCLQVYTNGGRALSLTTDNRIVFSSDGAIRVWNLETGQVLRSPVHEKSITSMVVVRGNLVVSTSHSIKVWDLESGELVRALHTGGTNHFVLTSDGRVVFQIRTGIGVWHLESEWNPRSNEGHFGAVRCVVLTGNGHCVSGSDDGTIKMWDLKSGRLMRCLDGHSNSVRSLELVCDSQIVSGSLDSRVKLWDLDNGRLVSSLPNTWNNGVYSVALLGDGRIVFGTGNGRIEVWFRDSERPSLATRGAAMFVDALFVDALAVTDDDLIVIGQNNGTIAVLDPNGHRPRHVLEAYAYDPVSALAITRDATVVVGSSRGSIRVWDLQVDQPLRCFEGDLATINALEVIGEGRIVLGSSDHTVKTWNLDTGQRQTIFGNDASILALAISPDSRWVACGDERGRVWLFEYIQLGGSYSPEPKQREVASSDTGAAPESLAQQPQSSSATPLSQLPQSLPVPSSASVFPDISSASRQLARVRQQTISLPVEKPQFQPALPSTTIWSALVQKIRSALFRQSRS